MSKLDITSKLLEEEKQVEECTEVVDNDDVTIAVFVDTDLNTHLVVPVSTLITVLCLKKEICLHHYKLFPEFGCITIKSVLVNFHEKYYHLPDSMLLKSVFHGTGETWFVFADVWTPVSWNHLGINQVETSPQTDRDFKCTEPSSQPLYESQHVTPPPQLNELQDMSCKGKKKMYENNNQEKFTDGVSKIEFQNRPAVSPKKAPGIFLKELLDEQTRGCDKWHAHTMSSPKHLKDGGEKVVKLLEDGGNSTNVAETLNKDRGIDNTGLPIRAHMKETKKRKKRDAVGVDSRHAPEGPDIPELLSQPDPLNVEKGIEEDIAFLKSGKTSKKRKTNVSEQESQRNDEKVSPLHLNNATELSSQRESLNLFDKEKEIEDAAPLKSRFTAKKSKNEKAKIPSIKKQDFSSERHNDDHNAEPDDNCRPEEKVETMSRMLNETRNRKDVSEDPPGSSVKEPLDEANRGMGPPTTVIQSDRSMKRSRKKQAKSLVAEIQELSSKGQNDELNAEYFYRPGESVETKSGKLKKSSKFRKDVPHKDPPSSSLKEQSDEKTWELAAPITVIQNDKPKKKRRKKQSIPGKDLCSVNQLVDEESLKMVAPKRDEGHQDELSEKTENPPQPREVSSDFSDFKHLEKPRSSKHKAKKLDQASSVDTLSNGHKLVGSKKVRDDKKTSLLHKFVTEHEHSKSRPPLMDPLVTQADPINSRKAGISHESVNKAHKVSGANFPLETNSSRRVEQADDLLTDSRNSDGPNQKEMTQGEDDHAHFSQSPNLEVSPVLSEAKPRASKEKEKNVDPPSSVDMSSNVHHSVGLKKSRGSAKTSMLQKPITDHKHDKSIPPSGAKHSTILKEVDTRIPLSDPTRTPRKNVISSRSIGDGSKSSEATSFSSGSPVRKVCQKKKTTNPPRKMEAMTTNPRRSSHLSEKETVKTPEQKKGLLASSEAIFEDGSSSSSDDDDKTDDRNNASSLSTTITPDNLSSSDYSEGESKGVGESKHDYRKGNGRSEVNSSGYKLESILRSSSIYKKAKSIASQSQEESQPLEFVPDSLADDM